MSVLCVFVFLFAVNHATTETKALDLKAVPKSDWATQKQKYVSEEMSTTLAAANDYVIYELDMGKYMSNINSTDGLEIKSSALAHPVDAALSNKIDFSGENSWIISWDDITQTDLTDCHLKSQKYYFRLKSSSKNTEPLTVKWKASIEIDTDDWGCNDDGIEKLEKAIGEALIVVIVLSVICGLCCIGIIASCVCGAGWVCCNVCLKEDKNTPKD